MNHRAAPSFWEAYGSLPPATRDLADRSFELLKQNPSHYSLRLKKVGRFWSVRIGLHHRALAVGTPDGFLWFWIGDHRSYERLIS